MKSSREILVLLLAAAVFLTARAFIIGPIGGSASSKLILQSSFASRQATRLTAKKDWSPPSPSPSTTAASKGDEESGISYSLEMGKRAGINWGSDLSFRWVYVLSLEPEGEAAQTGIVQKGDYIIGFGNTSTISQDFDYVLTTLNKQQESRFNYTFFRGSKEQLMGGPMPQPSETTVTVTVVQDGKKDVKLQCPGGTNLRRLLVGNGINVYR